MTEYWIPAADLLSAAVVGVCFLIAVIVINQQTAGRPRTLALLGVAAVLGGTMLQALNGSLAGAYGRESLAYAVVAIIVGIISAAGLVLLAFAVRGARRAIRARGDR
jgi:drug/metabolite transporter (DMT)-like permease